MIFYQHWHSHSHHYRWFNSPAAKCEGQIQSSSHHNEKPDAEAAVASTDPLGIFSKFLERPSKLTADEKFVKGIVPLTEESGGRPHREDRDQKSHQAFGYPWPSDRVPHHPHSHEDDGDQQHIAATSLPAQGYRSPPRFESEWEKHLAYHHGLYLPAAFKPAKTVDEIRREVEDFTSKVHQDNPQDACQYLLLEEQKCLSRQQFEMDPQQASQKCIKWFAEWRQCKWDEQKMKRGYNYIEPRQERKHRPAYSTPDVRYS